MPHFIVSMIRESRIAGKALSPIQGTHSAEFLLLQEVFGNIRIARCAYQGKVNCTYGRSTRIFMRRIRRSKVRSLLEELEGFWVSEHLFEVCVQHRSGCQN